MVELCGFDGTVMDGRSGRRGSVGDKSCAPGRDRCSMASTAPFSPTSIERKSVPNGYKGTLTDLRRRRRSGEVLVGFERKGMQGEQGRCGAEGVTRYSWW